MKFISVATVLVCSLSLTVPASADFFGDPLKLGQFNNAIGRATQDAAKTIQKAQEDAAKAAQQAATEKAKAELLEKVQVARSTSSIIERLKSLSLDTLYALKVSPDICGSGIINCEVLTNDKVRPLLDIELDRRKAALDFEDKTRNFYVSLGSLIVSLCAFGVSIFGAIRSKKGPAVA